MARYRRRRSVTSVNRDKYSVERTAFFTNVQPTTTSSINVVPPTAVRGMRKVKHLNISVSGQTAADAPYVGLYWALVYVPEGYTPQAFGVPDAENPSVDLYGANQFVMDAGVIDFDAGPQRIRTPLSRNLNSGDSIVLLLRTTVGSAVGVHGVVKYAITLQ